MWVKPERSRYVSTTRLVDIYWKNAVFIPLMVIRMHRKGFLVVVWTVNSVRLMKLLRWMGVDGITTDRPDLWRQAGS